MIRVRFFAVLVLSLMLPASVLALDPGQVKDDQGPYGGGTPEEESACKTCCTQKETNPFLDCGPRCICINLEGPEGGCAGEALAASVSPSQEIKGMTTQAAQILQEMIDQGRPAYAQLFEKYDARLASMLARDRRFAARMFAFVRDAAPGILAMRPGSSADMLVSREQIAELRGLLEQAATLDRRHFDGGLAGAIEQDVLGKVDRTLVGMSYRAAVGCILGDGCR